MIYYCMSSRLHFSCLRLKWKWYWSCNFYSMDVARLIAVYFPLEKEDRKRCATDSAVHSNSTIDSVWVFMCVCVFLVSQHLLHKKHLLVHPAHILPDGLVTSIFIFYFCFDVKSAVTYFNFSVSVRWLTLRLHDAANRKKPTGGTFCDSHQRGRWLLLVASMCKFFRFLNNFSKKKKKNP